jgi:hypothetical protein
MYMLGNAMNAREVSTYVKAKYSSSIESPLVIAYCNTCSVLDIIAID